MIHYYEHQFYNYYYIIISTNNHNIYIQLNRMLFMLKCLHILIKYY
jgi:hypothetical protein